MTHVGSESLPMRRALYGVLIAVALGSVAGRILAVNRLTDPSLTRDESDPDDKRPVLWPKNRPQATPTLGDNDRSRWDTVRSLVDNGTYAIGHREYSGKSFEDKGIITEDGWRTIDKVLRPDTHDFYSSKPPLL